MTDYEKIEQAIQFIRNNVESQPSLEEIASEVCLSPFHFQKLFSRWAGISPKRFLQVLTLNNAKDLVQKTPSSLLSLSENLGLSSSSRLYDHFVSIEAITPAEYKKKAKGLNISYGLAHSPFGKCFIASTFRGICKISFLSENILQQPFNELVTEWPDAKFDENNFSAQNITDRIFEHYTAPNAKQGKPLSLYVKGTNFQINVWKALLKLQKGELASYQQIAQSLQKPQASRAVGTAIGKNPVGLLIPCHRVIRQSGELGGYRWGLNRKHALLACEQANKEDISL